MGYFRSAPNPVDDPKCSTWRGRKISGDAYVGDGYKPKGDPSGMFTMIGIAKPIVDISETQWET